MKDNVQWTPFTIAKILSRVGLEPGTARSVGQRLTTARGSIKDGHNIIVTTKIGVVQFELKLASNLTQHSLFPLKIKWVAGLILGQFSIFSRIFLLT